MDVIEKTLHSGCADRTGFGNLSLSPTEAIENAAVWQG
jgi:hypothetical protein